MPNILVVAHSYSQARYYMGQMAMSDQTAAIITGPEKIYGYHDLPIVYVGEYWRIKGIEHIREYAETHGLREKDLT